MTPYINFIGIDMGKFSFVVATNDQKTTQEYENSSAGIGQFIEDTQSLLATSLLVVETTGGYELNLLYTLCQQGHAVHRADTRKVKNFIRSYGSAAKTDALDAKALALYGKERGHALELFQPQSQQAMLLFQLVQRRADLKQILVAEKNRLQSPSIFLVEQSFRLMIETVEAQLQMLNTQIQQLIAQDPVLKKKHTVLKTIPGIGDIVASELLIMLPELGTLSRRKIASLAGVAPRANDSGQYQGYRHTGHGRGGVKPLLFIASMAARNSHSPLKAFYEKLVAKGKKKMVALTALMRKILVIANARIRDLINTEAKMA